MRFVFIRAKNASYPVTVLCRVLEVTRSGYYAFEKRLPSERTRADAQQVVKIRTVHERGRRKYGSPRVHEKLTAQGERVGRHRVARLMKENGIQARRTRRFCRTTDSRHCLPVADNVLDRRFEVEAPNLAWVTDITYVPTDEGWLYVAAIIDLFSRRVVGLSMSERIDRRLALAALGEAMQLRRPRIGLLHHSDRRSQYASLEYQDALRECDVRCSMSRRGNSWDNAVAESFFSTLKVELGHDEHFATRAQAEAAIREYVERFYNVERLHSALGYVSPIEYELMAQVTRSAA